MVQNYQGNFPKNAMFGHAYVMDQVLNKTFSPEEALKRGTVFPELATSYFPGDSMREIEFLKNYGRGGLKRIMEMSNQQNRDNLLRKIMEYKFYINDLSLYLDTHPNDRRALSMHNEYVQKLDEVTKEFEKMYGPLTIETVMESWEWAQDLWPWQRGFNR